ncbi:putative isomerase [Actinoplanes italicus]|uniref:PhzF family phenazine biosynthesis protein n=1 Tax=Actinoplanes italicus TaxID=113567 RepID=A0A2T0KFU1_9ACTN|nr:PhzF family phenazine biosynthesis protein [Actinoplanes italicus]PRX22247.1 PhzF family phenazine biosynthesis protein [Actinoplanes italicus]GIE29333.1 putative isomerase [Actinoplanes italicus]
MRDPRVTVLAACTRDGRGGSPTAVMIDDATLTDDGRRAIAVAAGTSHTAFIEVGDTPAVRFFTAAGELLNCGHGTLAAQAFLLDRGSAGQLRTGGRTFATAATRRGDGIEVWFDQGLIELSRHAGDGGDLIAALGLTPDDVAGDLRVASPGTRRLLVPVHDRRTLTAMRPDFARLAAECRRAGCLGCFAYTLEPPGEPAVEMQGEPAVGPPGEPPRLTVAARMFAPVIGVDEDIVNANSAGCLAAHLLDTGRGTWIEVHQGDTLGRPSTVRATAARTPDGITTRIGGLVHYPACSW